MKKTASAQRKVSRIMIKPNPPAWRWDDSDGPHRQALAARVLRLWPRIVRIRPRAATLSLAFAWAALSPLQAEPLVDSTGRTQEVAAPVSVAVPAGPPAQILLQAIAPGKLGALVEAFGPDHVMYVDARVAALPHVAMLTRSAAPSDIAAVTALKPGLMVDYGSLSPRYVAAAEKIAEELRVPAVLFSGDLADVPATVRTLAKPLGEVARGEAVASAAQQVLDALKPLGALSDAERVGVYVARGADGLNAVHDGSALDEPIRLAGGRNVVSGGGGGMFRRMDVDAVVALKPAVVVVSDIEALKSPLRAALPKDTRFVLDAGEPYKVLTGAPSLNRLVGALALAAILHPGKAENDPDAIRRLETSLFPIPPGLAVPAPLQVRE